MLDMNRLAAKDDNEDNNIEFGKDSQHKREQSLPTMDLDQDYSKLIESDPHAEEVFGDISMPEARNTKERCSLKMIDKVHSEKLNGKTLFTIDKLILLIDLKKIREQKAGENELDRSKSSKREMTFKANTSLNQTVLDGSVIIHTGQNKYDIDHQTSGTGEFGTSAYDIDPYYDPNDKSAQKKINISVFDDLGNASLAVEDNIQPQNTNKETSNPPMFGTLAGLKQKIKEIQIGNKGNNQATGTINIKVAQPDEEVKSRPVLRKK